MDISVVICTYNRSKSLRQTLQTCCDLVSPCGIQWELLVVDNNSTDATEQVCEFFADKLILRYLFESQPGKSFALNRAIAEATGKLLLFTDDDVDLDQYWLLKLHEAADTYPNSSFFGGRVFPRWETAPPKWLVQNSNSDLLRWVSVHLDMGEDIQPVSDRLLFFGANIAFRRQVFENGLRFRTDLGPKPSEAVRGEESELIKELLRLGATGLYIPSAVVFHRNPKYRMTERYLREWYCGLGMREVRLGQVGGSQQHSLFGAPRYLWRKLGRSALNYAFTRWTRPSAVWLRAEVGLAMNWGMIREFRRAVKMRSSSR